MTSKEVCDYLGMSDGRVRQLTRLGELKGTKVGRDWVYRLEDVQAFAALPRPKPGRKAGKTY